MNPLQAHLALQAAHTDQAQPKATRRHIHLNDRPLVVVDYHLAGDIGAPVALMWGTDRDRPHLVVVPESRNRTLRFDALGVFGDDLMRYLDGFSTRLSHRSGRPGREREQMVCADAPQLITPNPATADWLFGKVGRFTRDVRPDGEQPAPAVVPVAGKHLSFFHDRLPGGSLELAG